MFMKKDSLVVTKSNNIATIYINNLEKKNAMTLNMWKKNTSSSIRLGK